jgi:uncharacterized membrane protein YhaH (DUF805 family)
MNQPMTPSGQQNPYRAPSSTNINNASEDYQDVKIFAVDGRIGRVRYIVYTIGLTVAIMLVGGVLGAITAGIGMIVAYIALLVIQFMLTIQRCHDFNASGWLSILVLVPLVGLMFWFIPGTDGPNRWGDKTKPNSTALVVGAWICALIIPLTGILAAIAIPQYQKYVERAKVMQQQK